MKKFDQLLTIIYKKSTFQKKRIQKLLQKRDALYFVEAETFAEDYVGYLNRQGVPIESAVDSYLGLCADTLKCQIQFSKTGKYPTNSQSSAVEKVYNNEARYDAVYDWFGDFPIFMGNPLPHVFIFFQIFKNEW